MDPDALSYGDRHATREAPVPRRRMPRAPGVRGLLATAGAVAAGILVAVLAAGVSLAYLNASAPAGQVATITAGTTSLNLKYGSGTAAQAITIPASTYQKMLPGDVVGVQLDVINVGDVPQTVAATVSATGAWETRVALGTCPSTVLAGAALATTPGGSAPLAVGATQQVCVQVALPIAAAAASENTTLTYTVNFDGTQSAS